MENFSRSWGGGKEAISWKKKKNKKIIWGQDIIFSGVGKGRGLYHTGHFTDVNQETSDGLF